MQNLYLTELKNFGRPKSNPRNASKKLLKEFDLKSQTQRANSSDSDKIYPKNKNFYLNSKSQYLDYFIDEQTNFGDLEKIETYYKSLIINSNREHNNKKYLIQKKKEELRKLEESIQNNLLISIKFSKEEIEKFNENIKEDLKLQITHKSYDLECYTNIKERLYKSNVIYTNYIIN